MPTASAAALVLRLGASRKNGERAGRLQNGQNAQPVMGVLSFLVAMKTGLEFIIARLSKLPRRQELALRPLYIITGSVGRLVIAWIELFGRVCLQG
jgi:hypothetical protein